jgi:arylsulfatase A-like enzyme
MLFFIIFSESNKHCRKHQAFMKMLSKGLYGNGVRIFTAHLCFRILMISTLILSLHGCRGSGGKPENKRPNMLVLIADDQRWDQLSYADQPLIAELETPNLDRLAGGGVYFRNAFVTTPICAVSRASIMTGRYASTHGMNHFQTPMTPEVLRKTYPALLHDNGYKTGVLGKWGIGTDGTEAIFDLFNAWAGQGKYFHDTDSGKIHNAEWLAIEARKFLASCDPEQPFCLTVCYKSPHHPYQPDERDKDLFSEVLIPKRTTDTPEGYQAMAHHVMEGSLNRWCYFDERKDEATKNRFEKDFLRCVVSLDRSVGKIMQALQDLDLDQNTVIVYVSDNGYLWGEHGLGGKWLLYEESIRVPLILHVPGIPESLQGRRLDQLALNIDVAPTLLDIAGIPVPDEMDGTSLYPHLKGLRVASRADFFMEHVGIVDVENPIPDSRGVRSGEWKYIRYINLEPEVEELYHLETDPHESHNLINDTKFSEIRDQLRERYDQYLESL